MTCGWGLRCPAKHWYPVTESLCTSASVRSRARGRRCAPGYVAGMVLEPEPVLVTDPTLTEVLDELRAREPLFHRPEFGTTRSHLEAMTTEDFWEVGASGCV